jgi:hypothetical protein
VDTVGGIKWVEQAEDQEAVKAVTLVDTLLALGLLVKDLQVEMEQLLVFMALVVEVVLAQ